MSSRKLLQNCRNKCSITPVDLYAQKISELLKKNHYSLTTPRKVVFEVLYSFGLQTVQQLISRSKSIDRSSVYRALRVLEDVGAAHRVPQGFKYKVELSDAFLPHHHHIACTQCGRHSDIEQNKLEEILAQIAEENSYTLTSHKVELLGVCANCAGDSLR